MRAQLEINRMIRYSKNSPDKSSADRPVTPDMISNLSTLTQDMMNASFASSAMGSLTPRSIQIYPVPRMSNPGEKEEFEKKMQELEEYTKIKDEEVMNLIENLKKEKESSDTKAAEIEQKLEAVEMELTEKVDKVQQLNEELVDLRAKYENDRLQIETLVKKLEDNQHENNEILKKLNTQTSGLQTDHDTSKEEFQKSYKEMLEAQQKILEENRLLANALKESTENITQLQDKISELQAEIKSEEKVELNTREDTPTNDELNNLEQEMAKQRKELELLRREIHNRKPSKDYTANNSCRGCSVF